MLSSLRKIVNMGETYAQKTKAILLRCGGDYTPEQWDESVWQEDMRLYLVGLTYNQMRKRMSSQL